MNERAAFEAFDYSNRYFRLRRDGRRYVYATTERELTAFRAGAAWQASLKAEKGEAVAIAECREVHGHMCQFLNRTQHGMDTLRDGDKLYTAPPVSVPAAMPERWEDRLSRMHQTIPAGCWPKRWIDDAKDYELGELRALLARQEVN